MAGHAQDWHGLLSNMAFEPFKVNGLICSNPAKLAFSASSKACFASPQGFCKKLLPLLGPAQQTAKALVCIIGIRFGAQRVAACKVRFRQQTDPAADAWLWKHVVPHAHIKIQLNAGSKIAI